MFMEESFRWYGPKDPVPLEYVRQTGAKGVVSSLHHIPYGEVWPVEEILAYKKKIEDAGLIWNVVESLPVHEDIKLRAGRCEEYIENYKISLRNLGRCGVRVITYNFMPVLDWIRTDLHYKLPDGSEALFFNQKEFAAFEIFILGRKGAEKDYSPEMVEKAREYYNSMTPAQRDTLTRGIIDNFPGFKGVTLEDIRSMLARYAAVTREDLKANLKHFLSEVVPVAQEAGCIMVIHPDDPPRSILGLPRIFSTQEDIHTLLGMVDNPANGIYRPANRSGRTRRRKFQRKTRQQHRGDVQILRSARRLHPSAQHAARQRGEFLRGQPSGRLCRHVRPGQGDH